MKERENSVTYQMLCDNSNEETGRIGPPAESQYFGVSASIEATLGRSNGVPAVAGASRATLGRRATFS